MGPNFIWPFLFVVHHLLPDPSLGAARTLADPSTCGERKADRSHGPRVHGSARTRRWGVGPDTSAAGMPTWHQVKEQPYFVADRFFQILQRRTLVFERLCRHVSISVHGVLCLYRQISSSFERVTKLFDFSFT